MMIVFGRMISVITNMRKRRRFGNVLVVAKSAVVSISHGILITCANTSRNSNRAGRNSRPSKKWAVAKGIVPTRRPIGRVHFRRDPPNANPKVTQQAPSRITPELHQQKKIRTSIPVEGEHEPQVIAKHQLPHIAGGLAVGDPFQGVHK